MKFVCSNCKAKYQIADEKILGRTLKMDCRRCNTAITIRGDLPQQADDVEMEADAPAARAPSRRPGAAAGGSSVGASPSRPRSAATGSLAGHPSPSSLGADFRRGSLAPESRPEARTSVLDQWHVAINDVPVGPMRREEVSRKIATGAVSAESLAWREGFDDWRPVRDIPELAALLRKAEPLPNRSMPGPRGATGAGARLAASSPSRLGARPAASATSTAAAARAGNVVPIGGRHGGAAPALDEFESLEGDQDQDEATQVASAADLGLLALTAKPEAKATPKAPEKPRAPERRDPTGPARPAPPRPKNDVFAPKPVAAPPAEVAPPSPVDDGLPPLVSPSLPPPEPAAAFAPMPAPAAAPIAPVASIPAQRADEKRRRGLPVGAWMGIAGAMAFGVVFALMAAQRMFPAAATAPATATVVPPAAPTGPVEAPLELDPVVDPPETETPPVAEETPETPPATAPTTTTGGSPRGTTTGRTTGTGGTGSTPSSGGSPALSADFARLADDSSGPRTFDSEATRRSLGDSASSSGSELTSEQISHVVTRERAGLQRCWETAIRGMRETPTVRMDIDLTIGSSGTVTAANARGPSVGTLTDCIERSVRRWRFPTSSGTSRTSFPIVFSGTN